ncbi:phosphoglycolate phosphatase [Paenalcaligenes hominis]|uniref:phosphoglycolate phosphatase n=1 Tax=Paenalcaligenes hominis TaxID=643674 RepID=UPI0035253182
MLNKLVLFDFDGTLVDSAPDLAASANHLRKLKNLEPLPLSYLRPYASKGARGLLQASLQLETDHPDYETEKDTFLAHYAANSTVLSRPFDGIETLVEQLNELGLAWGVVTNKVVHLTQPIMDHFGLSQTSKVLVGGDSTPHIKPHPAPLLLACELTGISPENCIYVGDDERDIVAGKAAGMATLVAAYGYCDFDPAIASWQADYVSQHASEILPCVLEWAQK